MASNENLLKQLVLLEAVGKAAGNNKSSKNKVSALKSTILNQLERKKKRKYANENSYYRNENVYRNSSGRVRSIPEPTPYYNQSLRRFLYRPSIGFYVILGLDRNGKAIKKRVPGHFYYRYDEKLARIVPFRRKAGMRPVPRRKSEEERRRERRNNNNRNRNRN